MSTTAPRDDAARPSRSTLSVARPRAEDRSTTEFVADLLSNGVELRVEDGRVRYRGPAASLGRDVVAALAARKAALLVLLGSERYVPPSMAQQRAWLLEQLEPGNVANHRQALFRVQRPLPVDALRRALQALVRRHGILRTRFPVLDARPCQVIMASGEIPLRVVDPGVDADGERDRAARLVAAAEARERFDLSRGPCVRAVMVGTPDSGTLLLLTAHQIVVDAWSMSLIAGELPRLLGTAGGGPEIAVAPAGQYAEFCHYEREWLASPEAATQLAYWRARLETAPRRLVWSSPDRAGAPSRGARRDFTMASDDVQRLDALARAEEATIFMVWLALLCAAIYRRTGQADVTIGSTVTNRSRHGMRDVLGYFANVLPLRVEMPGPATFRALLRHVRQVALDGYAHQDVPIERLLAESWVRRRSGFTPLYQVMVTFVDAPVSAGSFTLLPIEGEWTTTVDVALTVARDAGGLAGTVYYRRDLPGDEVVEALLRDLHYLLASMPSGADAALGSL